MKKLIVMVVLVCLSIVTFSAETNCVPANSDKTKQTTPTKNTKKSKKPKTKTTEQKKETNKSSGMCKIK